MRKTQAELDNCKLLAKINIEIVLRNQIKVYICITKSNNMAHIKNQNIFHQVSQDGKKTACGLSNQFNDAVSYERFINYLNDKNYFKYCCKKCQQKNN